MQLKALFAIDQYCATPIVEIDAFTVGESGKDTKGEDTWERSGCSRFRPVPIPAPCEPEKTPLWR